MVKHRRHQVCTLNFNDNSATVQLLIHIIGNALLRIYIEKLHEFKLEFLLQRNNTFLTPGYLDSIGYFKKLQINVVILDKCTSTRILYQSPEIIEAFMTVFLIGFKIGDFDFRSTFREKATTIYETPHTKSFYDTVICNRQKNTATDNALLHVGLVYRVDTAFQYQIPCVRCGLYLSCTIHKRNYKH